MELETLLLPRSTLQSMWNFLITQKHAQFIWFCPAAELSSTVEKDIGVADYKLSCLITHELILGFRISIEEKYNCTNKIHTNQSNWTLIASCQNIDEFLAYYLSHFKL